MGIKKNVVYSSILLTGNYIFPLITFPYISRVLGVSQIGVINFVDSIVNYYVMFSMLGLNILGIREIAKNKINLLQRSKIFSTLLSINFILTIILLAIYLGSVLFVPQFYLHRELFYVGAFKLFFNIFLIEWLYRGLENFQYITLCNLFLRFIYVIALFVWVDDAGDIVIYYLITVALTVFTALINSLHAYKYVSFRFTYISNIRYYIRPYIELGIYLILTSMYTTFNVVYLGLVSTQAEVGYYVTALKLYTIILGVFTAFTNVLMPRMSALLADNDVNKFQSIIRTSLLIVIAVCVPIICYVLSMASDIILIIAGKGYEGAIILTQIIIFVIAFVGLAQILAIQILIPLKKDNVVLCASFMGALVGIILNIGLVRYMASLGTAMTLCISEAVVTSILLFYVLKKKIIDFPWHFLCKDILYSVPIYLLINYCVLSYWADPISRLVISALLYLITFVFTQTYILKNPIFLSFFKRYM